MPDFDRKRWLDDNVVPLLHQDPPASIYTVFWNGAPPKEILVLLLAGKGTDDGITAVPDEAWPQLVKRLLVAGFTFDFLRDVQPVVHEGKKLVLFGGDGAPFFDKSGYVSARLHKKLETGESLILQIGHKYDDGVAAALAVKTFFAQWDAKNPFDVCAEFSAPFGQA